MNTPRNCLLAVSLLSIAFVAVAHESPALVACTKRSDNAERLACFDQAMTKPTLNGAVAKTSDATPAKQPDLEYEFGMDDELKRRLRKNKPEDTLDKLTATVSKIHRRPRGELVITLDNQQIWVEKNPSSYFPLSDGDSVTIKSGVLGSFRLVGPSGRTTRVSRVK